MNYKRLIACLLALGAWAPTAGMGQEAASGVVISSKIPADIQNGAQKATLTAAAEFAWNEFIALNWPAAVASPLAPIEISRETPDLGLPFGQGAANTANQRPLVWETFRHKVEIFPSRTSIDDAAPTPTPHGYGRDLPRAGYDAPPKYPYDQSYVGGDTDVVPPCPGQAPAAGASWVNLDETSEIGLAGMHAGANASIVSADNTDVTLFRYLAKANYVEYKYVVDNEFWYHSSALARAEDRFRAAIDPRNPNPSLAGTVQFPAGTIEIKSAWRPLTEAEAKSGRFHQLPVRFYEKPAGGKNKVCYFEKTWGLVSLHIIQKTPSAPEFVFATFEQADAILTKDGQSVEDDDGNPTAVAVAPGVTRPLEFSVDKPDYEGGPVVAVNNDYCRTAGGKDDKRLFFRELPDNAGLPSGGAICVNQRAHAIEPAVIAVNTAAHRTIAAYNEQKNVKDSPWTHYKLVSVQAFPFDKSLLGTPGHSASTFFQANIAVETDYTLQNFSGRLSGGGPGTDYPAGKNRPDFKNVYHFVPGGSVVAHFDSFQAGGCQGCHGNAQVGGTDFSFILDGSTFNKPEAPEESLALKFRSRF
jgi:hypothetical protein